MITKDLIAIAFEWAVQEEELNILVVHAKTTLDFQKRVKEVKTLDQVKELINLFLDTGELPQEE